MILNCDIPTKKVSEFLDHHLKPVMQESSHVSKTQEISLRT